MLFLSVRAGFGNDAWGSLSWRPPLFVRPLSRIVRDSSEAPGARGKIANHNIVVGQYRFGTPITHTTGVGNAYDRHREVVQRRQGFWIHHPRERREGLLRPSLRHPGQGIPFPGRG